MALRTRPGFANHPTVLDGRLSVAIGLHYESSHECDPYRPFGLLDGSDPEIDSVDKFLQETDGGGFGQFVEVSGKAGGTKYMECRVYCQPLIMLTLT